ncbi:MAG: acyltransferase, partial [Anaerolineaceae bacterium]|nr:acyltransferase [Anaerolineaceae bacterium]
MSQKPKKTRPSFRGLQVLRAVAAFLVVVTHSGFYASERLSKGFHFWGRGAVGVDIFFVLSGFVMYYSSAPLLANRDGWKIFSERRLVRIVPLYWLATSVKLLVMLLAAGVVLHAKLSISKTIFAYLFIPTRDVDKLFMPLLGVGWTLNFEMFFYLLFAVALASRRNIFLIVAPILLCFALASYFISPDGPAITFYANPIVLDFLWGMLIAYFYETRTPTLNW